MQTDRRREASSEFDADDICADALFYPLFAEAERVRWRSGDIDWAALEPERVTPELISLVRDAAFAELTTHSATRRFLQEFADDVDFTQWIAVWFYEESTHPQVLMQWLHRFGVKCGSDEIRRHRQSTPFMRSRFGTLVTNVISETLASHDYLALHHLSKEPVLASITRFLAADEARHARSFLAYARRLLAASPHPELERLLALEVLHSWFEPSVARATHPVSESRLRTGERALPGRVERLGLKSGVAQQHACRAIGSLIGHRLDSAAAALALSRELRARLNGKDEPHATP